MATASGMHFPSPARKLLSAAWPSACVVSNAESSRTGRRPLFGGRPGPEPEPGPPPRPDSAEPSPDLGSVSLRLLSDLRPRSAELSDPSGPPPPLDSTLPLLRSSRGEGSGK